VEFYFIFLKHWTLPQKKFALPKGHVSLMEEESFYSSRGLIVAGKNVQPFAVAMASSHAMEFLATRCRVAIVASKLYSIDVAASNVLSGSEFSS
jgi:hypothetical protein